MNILVANLGSTSFKYRVFAVGDDGEPAQLAQGGYERVEDHGEAISDAVGNLRAGGIIGAAVGFKTVLGENLSGCVEADDACLAALEGAADLAPAHNPAYAAGIRAFRRILPGARLVALFETAFYQWMPPPAKAYGVPAAWADAGIRRHGFHGASHKFIAEKTAELAGRDDVLARARSLYQGGGERPLPDGTTPFRVISCHLGGSSSLTAIRDGIAVATSMGLSPQSGLPQNNRVGDLDIMAIPRVLDRLGIPLEEAYRQLSKEGGLLGLSGVSNDLRDIRREAAEGNERAAAAVDFLVHEIRRYLGSFAFLLGGLDVVSFTAGIGENDTVLRERVLGGLESFGIRLDPGSNADPKATGGVISADGSAVQVRVIPANEERVVALETWRYCRNN